MSEFWTRVEDGLPEVAAVGEVLVFFMVSDYYPMIGYYQDGEDEDWKRGFHDWECVWHENVTAWAYVPPLEKK